MPDLKKILSFFSVSIFVFTIFLVMPFDRVEAATNTTLTTQQKIQEIGSTFIVNLGIQTSQKITAAEIHINFPSKNLSVVKINSNPKTFEVEAIKEIKNDKILLVYTTNTAKKGSLSVAQITFKTKAIGNSKISISNLSIVTNRNGENILSGKGSLFISASGNPQTQGEETNPKKPSVVEDESENTISVQVKDASGNTIRDSSVHLIPGGIQNVTDSKGRFSIRSEKNKTYEIFVLTEKDVLAGSFNTGGNTGETSVKVKSVSITDRNWITSFGILAVIILLFIDIVLIGRIYIHEIRSRSHYFHNVSKKIDSKKDDKFTDKNPPDLTPNRM